MREAQECSLGIPDLGDLERHCVVQAIGKSASSEESAWLVECFINISPAHRRVVVIVYLRWKERSKYKKVSTRAVTCLR